MILDGLSLAELSYRLEPGDGVSGRVRANIPDYKRAVSEYQGFLLYQLSRQYDFKKANILEIGTAYGFSTAYIAEGAPKARITTLNPKSWEAERAVKHLEAWSNVKVEQEYSWDFLAKCSETYDMIFVDGDHKRIALDLPYWNLIRPGGLFIHHDYSPQESARPCQVVYDALNDFGRFLGRSPDVLVVDEQHVGMAGWYKGKDDKQWPTQQPQS